MFKSHEKKGTSKPKRFGLLHLFFWMLVVSWLLAVLDTSRSIGEELESGLSLYLLAFAGSIPIAWLPLAVRVYGREIIARQCVALILLAFVSVIVPIVSVMGDDDIYVRFKLVLAIWFVGLFIGTMLVGLTLELIYQGREWWKKDTRDRDEL